MEQSKRNFNCPTGWCHCDTCIHKAGIGEDGIVVCDCRCRPPAGNSLEDEVIDILRDSRAEVVYRTVAKNILEKVWASEEFIEKAEEHCREQGWSWPDDKPDR